VATEQAPQTPPQVRPAAAVTPPASAHATGRNQGHSGDDLDMDELARERDDGPRPYLKFAFSNPYNLALLAGGIATALLNFSPVLAVLTVGLESIWLLHAPDSPLLRRLLWDPQFERFKGMRAAAERAEKLKPLDRDARERVQALIERQAQIHRLAAQNPSFAADLLRTELGKTDRLVDAFLDMSVTCQRYEAYLDNVDTKQLDRDKERYGHIAKAGAADDPEAQIAQKNVAVVDKRMAKLDEIGHFLKLARGQLDLIENSFQLLVEQIVTMQSPRELSGQLDELLDGVESIRETTRDTENLIGRLDADA
jgi:hypothetical protein